MLLKANALFEAKTPRPNLGSLNHVKYSSDRPGSHFVLYIRIDARDIDVDGPES